MKATVPVSRAAVRVCLLLLISLPCFSQSISFKNGKYEAGLGLGPSFFLGDLGGSRGTGKGFIKDIDLPLTKMSKGLFINVYPAEWLGFRMALNFSFLEGSDDQVNLTGGREYSRWRRNQYFQSNITEGYIGIELYPTVFLERFAGFLGRFRPYGIAGVGAFHFNPKGYYYPNPNNKDEKVLVELKPLRLEGQGMAEYPDRQEYKLTQLEIPMGAGLKFYVTEQVYIGFEILHRKTFTDYIDDVSTKYIDPIYFQKYLKPGDIPVATQLFNREPFRNVSRPIIGKQRGDSKQMDSFFSTLVRVGWRIGGSNTQRAKALRQAKCPIFY